MWQFITLRYYMTVIVTEEVYDLMEEKHRDSNSKVLEIIKIHNFYFTVNRIPKT